MRKEVDINELVKRKEEILEEFKQVKFKDRDYTEYRKVCMKIKYHTDKNERERQLEYSRERFRKLYNDPDYHKKYNEYQLKYYHNHKEDLENVNYNVEVM